MAVFMRSLSSRKAIVTRQISPSFSCILHDTDDKKGKPFDEGPPQRKISGFLQQTSFGSSFSSCAAGYGPFFRDNRSSNYSVLRSAGFSFCRFMSTTVNEASNKNGLMSDVPEFFNDASMQDVMSDVPEVFTDAAMQAVATQAPAVSEVAIAAADSFLPVAALQYLIDGVHSFTGFNWWACIALTTLLIRTATLLLLVYQLKAPSLFTVVMSRVDEIEEELQKYGATPIITSFKGVCLHGSVFLTFYFAISNMVEKVPSFKSGGAYWFMDLTTPDSFYILPFLTGLSFLITVQCNMNVGREGNRASDSIKKCLEGFAVLLVTMTLAFPKALFFYWVTSNLFTFVYGTALKAPGVKKFLGVPEISYRDRFTRQRYRQ